MLYVYHINPLDQASRSVADDNAMWEAVKKVEHFFDKLEPIPGAINMFKTLYSRYGNKCEILSGIPKPRRDIMTSGEDKTEWSHRFLGEDIVVNIVFREEKKNYVKGAGYILIDDLEKNIKEWNEAGGTGIHFTNADEVLKKMAAWDV